MRYLFLSAAVLTVLLSPAAWSAESATPATSPFQLNLKNHAFTPVELKVPANQDLTITVKNADATPAEFESDDFKAEKVVAANSEISVHIAPLKPGSYEFHDEFHEDVAKGKLIVQ